MVKRLNQTLISEYPEVLELNDLLGLAEVTWQKYGISAMDLDRQKPALQEILKVLTSQSR